MKHGLSIILLAFTLWSPPNVISADKADDIKALSANFILEIYEDGIKQEGAMYVDIKILNKKEVQWTTIFFQTRCIKKDNPISIVSRWDEGIYDVRYDSKSFQLKLKFPFAEEEVIVRGTRIQNSTNFKVEGVGFRKDLSSKNVKIEWKSID